MANLKKYKKRELTHILLHDQRARGEDGEFIRFSNQSIDTSRTHENYNLHERNDGLTDYEFIESRGKAYLAKRVLNREDVNWAGSWVITLPEDLKMADKSLQRVFFEHALAFLKRRYGVENIVGAYVHNDETTPHMHVKITPVLFNEKKQKYHFSAKDMFNQKDLATFHDDLAQYMAKEFPLGVGVKKHKIHGKNKAPNKTIEELKQETLALQEEKDRQMAVRDMMASQVAEVKKKLEQVKLEQSKAEQDYENRKTELEKTLQNLSELLEVEKGKLEEFNKIREANDAIKADLRLIEEIKASQEKELLSIKGQVDALKEEIENLIKTKELIDLEMKNYDLLGRRKKVTEDLTEKLNEEVDRRVNAKTKGLEYKEKRLSEKSRELDTREKEVRKMVKNHIFKKGLEEENKRLRESNEALTKYNSTLQQEIIGFAREVRRRSPQLFSDIMKSLGESLLTSLFKNAGLLGKMIDKVMSFLDR